MSKATKVNVWLGVFTDLFYRKLTLVIEMLVDGVQLSQFKMVALASEAPDDVCYIQISLLID